jgi:hypothetical protein
MRVVVDGASRRLLEKLDKATKRHLPRGVRDIAFTIDPNRIVIHGRARSYNAAQLVLSAAMQALRSLGDPRPLRTKIVVDHSTG